jgi:hypothetical protein
MLSAVLYAATATSFALDVPPDAGLWEARMADAYIGSSTSSENPPNTRAIRMSTVSVNYGPGRLELRGGEIVGSQQRVYQRVFRDDGSFYDREAGWFIYHPGHGHIHFEDWTVFRLRERLPDGGVGPVVRTGAKTSFCILELATWDSTIPGYNTPPSYSSCGQIQGLRPGRADVYSSSLNGQFIPIDGVADGIYYLEGEIDPDNLVLEADETNNLARILFAIGPPPAAQPDPYEENDTIAQVNAQPEGGRNSPNLGLILVRHRIDKLSMEDANDYYRIKIHAGSAGDYIKIESPYLRTGNLNLSLLNSSGAVVLQSSGTYSYEYIPLKNIPAGTYYVQVSRATTTNNPEYSLEIEPGGNLPPDIVVTKPQAPGVWVERSLETFPVAWNGTDPDGDPKYISIFRDRQQVFGPTNQVIPGYENLFGNSGEVNINTVDFGLGKWFIFVRASDGAAFTDVWAPGYAGIYLKGDLNLDGILNKVDYVLLRQYDPHYTGMPEGYNPIADMNRDGVVGYVDLKILKAMIR